MAQKVAIRAGVLDSVGDVVVVVVACVGAMLVCAFVSLVVVLNGVIVESFGAVFCDILVVVFVPSMYF